MDKFYRLFVNLEDLYKIEINYKFTNILIISDKKIDELKIFKEIKKIYEEIEYYSIKRPLFLSSLFPISFDNSSYFKEIFIYSNKTKIGPLAGIAGFFAKKISEFIMREYFPNNLIIENGGDIFLKKERESKILIYAGDSPLSMKVGIKLPKGKYGIATSSKTVGHSISFGNADAVTVITEDPLISDFYATYFGNMIKVDEDFEKVFKIAKRLKEIKGLVIISKDKIGIYGVEIFKI